MQTFLLFKKLLNFLFKNIRLLKTVRFRDSFFKSDFLAKFVHFLTVFTSRRCPFPDGCYNSLAIKAADTVSFVSTNQVTHVT